MKNCAKRTLSLVMALLMLFSMSVSFATEPDAELIPSAPEVSAEMPAELPEEPDLPSEQPELSPVDPEIPAEAPEIPTDELIDNSPIPQGDKFTVSFMDGDILLFSQEVIGGENSIIPEAPTKEGYIFIEWYVLLAAEQDGDAPAETPYTFDAVTENLSVYARFAPISYTVAYSPNAEATAGEMPSSLHTYDIAAALSPCGFTLEGMSFGGWALAPDGEAVYSDTQEVLNLSAEDGAEVILYAVWNSPVIPYGFSGMPEGYVLSEKELSKKQALADGNIVNVLQSAIPGKDYIEDQVILLTDSREYADTVAAAYNAELIRFEDSVAVLELSDTTVLQALEVAADPQYNMPAVSQNNIITLSPLEVTPYDEQDVLAMAGEAIPTLQTWFDRPNDPFLDMPFDDDSFYNAPYQWMHEAVNTYAAWGVTKGEGVTVAVLDSGYHSNPDLDGKVTVSEVVTSSYNTNDTASGHGNHVMGIIGAKSDNYTYGCGIAPEADLLSICVLPGGTGSTETVVKGIKRAINLGADVINMSLGSVSSNYSESAAIQAAVDAGIPVIAAMGNDGSDLVCYPAAYDGVIAVAASDRSNARAPFSNFGAWADVAAPGIGILSTYMDGFKWMNGTSQAAPIVSGVAALYLSAMGSEPIYGGVGKDLNGDGWSDAEDVALLEKTLVSATNKTSSKNIGKGIIDASKLFGSIKDAPIFSIVDRYGHEITDLKAPVPYNGSLILDGDGNDAMIIYTTDGKNPAVKNGIVTYGEVYTGPIDLSTLQAGKKLTVKAMCISGMGVIGKAGTLSFTIGTAASTIEEVVFTESTDKLFAGKSFTFKAAVEPALNAPQNITWSIVKKTGSISSNTVIDAKKGTLKTTATDSGKVTIRAASQDNPSIYAEITVSIEVQGIIKAITLNIKDTPLVWSNSRTSSLDLKIDKLDVLFGKTTQSYTSAADISKYPVKWTSSNPSIVEVSADPAKPNGVIITSRGAGSATITCAATDGSGKKATCKVTVVPLFEEITITGNTVAMPGKTVTYKITGTPTTVKNPNSNFVIWKLKNVPSGVYISEDDLQSCSVFIPSNISHGSTFTLEATLANDMTVTDSINVKVGTPATRVDIFMREDNCLPYTENKDGTLKTATLYNVDMDLGYHDNRIDLDAWAVGSNADPEDGINGPYEWSSNKPEIADVDQYGVVTAKPGGKGGKVTITCTATDGSKKKASVNVTVNVPASNIHIENKLETQDDNILPLAFGKTANHTVTYGTAYGTPTTKKCYWSRDNLEIGFLLQWADTRGYIDYLFYAVNDDFFVNQFTKDIKLSSSGALSVSAKAEAYFYNWNNYYYNAACDYFKQNFDSDDIYDFRCYPSVSIFAATADGTDLWSNKINYALVSPTSKLGMVVENNYGNYLIYSNYPTFYNGNTRILDNIRLYTNSWYADFTITSSNPRVASVPGNVYSDLFYYDYWENDNYTFHEVPVHINGKGKATITVKANDGTNKSCKITLNVN